MKNFKRLFAIVISVALLLCSIPLVASADVSAIPELSTTYAVIDSLAGQWNTVTVPANKSMYNGDGDNYRMAGRLPGDYVFSAETLGKAEYIEMDVYVSADVANTSAQIVVSNNWDSADNYGKYHLPDGLKAGWNHIVLAADSCSGKSGAAFNLNSYNEWNSVFWDGILSATEDVTIAYGNVAITAETPAPDMKTEKPFTIATVNGIFWSKSGIAADYHMPPSGNDNNASWYGLLNKEIDTTKAEFVELDIYTNVAVSTQVWVSSGNWADAGRARREASFDLEAGWNHICIDFSTLGITSGALNRTAVKNIFLELTTPSTAASVSLKMANLAFTKDSPNMENLYTAPSYVQEGKFINRKYSAGQSTMDFSIGGWGGVFYYEFPTSSESGTINVSDAEYVEFDMYASAAMPATTIIFTSGNGDGPGRKGTILPALNAGWNHICIPMSNIGNGAGNYDPPEFHYNTSALNAFYVYNTNVQAVDTTVTSIDFAMANLAFTKSPVMKNTYDTTVFAKAGTVWNWSQAANEGMNWSDYSFINDGANVNITDAKYLEFDLYANVAKSSFSMWLSTSSGDSPARRCYSFAVAKGWNHYVIDLVKYNNEYATAETPWDTTAIKSFFLQPFTVKENYNYTFANVAFTTGELAEGGTEPDVPVVPDEPDTPPVTPNFPEPPAAEDTYTGSVIIDYVSGVNGTKTWDGNVTDIYNVVDNRFFINLNKTIDISKAEYIEFDIWVSAPMNNLNMWACNNFDGEGRFRNNIDFSKLNVGEWNHIVWDLSDVDHGDNKMDRTKWTSVFFEGDPNADGVELEVAIANLGVSKDFPDLNPTHFLVGTAFDGMLPMNTPNTVPAGQNLYHPYQMYNNFEVIDLSKADYIEIDIYASVDTEGSIYMWSSSDTATDRGCWKIPALKAGWNHVIIDKIKNYDHKNGACEFDPATFNSWRAIFFEGVPHSSKEVTFKMANLVATKFTPDYRNEYIPATTHTEIGGDGIFVSGGKMRWEAEGYVGNYPWYINKSNFTKVVDFNKGDYVEFDVFLGAKADNDIALKIGNDNIAWVNTTRDAVTIKTSEMNVGWNHVVVPISNFSNDGADRTAIKGFFFDGTLLNDAEAEIRFAFANFCLTVEATEKAEMAYTGKVISKFNGYKDVTVAAAGNIQNAATPIVLPVPMDVTKIDYIEMNLYVTAKCDLTFYLNATPIEEGEIYAEADAYYALDNLSYGWNQIAIPVAELTANEWFDPEAINFIYFEGVPATTYDVTFTVESLAATSASQEFDIVEGDYNVDDAVDMRDIIHVANQLLADEQGWFANVAEVTGAADGIIDALDYTALRKLLFASF